jgi:hypothetical protein
VRRTPLVVLVALAAATADAQVICRPDTLGTVVCPVGPLPVEPRSSEPSGARGLPGVAAGAGGFDTAPVVLPAGRTNTLGYTRIAPTDLGRRVNPLRCRTDALGNLRCN